MAAHPNPPGIRVHLGYFGPSAAPGESAVVRPRLPIDDEHAGSSNAVESAARSAVFKEMENRIRISLDVG